MIVPNICEYFSSMNGAKISSTEIVQGSCSISVSNICCYLLIR